jgi:REP element-mobilizing transposase RayT
MPRANRIHFAHAIYHVINRGNYRAPVFSEVGAAKAFETCLFEAASLHHWKIHAFVIMRNHFHLAVETPEANLAEGTHWLSSTYATRFNRFREERGHVFQGRYYAGLVQAGPSLLRVVNYIHLNPVRAGLAEAESLSDYRWSSLRYFLRGNRPTSLSCVDWLAELQLPDKKASWQTYHRLLTQLASEPARQKQDSSDQMDHSWAIGDMAWRRELAARFKSEGAAEPICGIERNALRAERWNETLTQALTRLALDRTDLERARKGADWKIQLAAELRRTCGANYTWLARELKMGKAGSVRALLSRRTLN